MRRGWRPGLSETSLPVVLDSVSLGNSAWNALFMTVLQPRSMGVVAAVLGSYTKPMSYAAS